MSNPPDPLRDVWLAGYVAAEGTFTGATTPTTRRFRFAVSVTREDQRTCHLLARRLACGTVRASPRRKHHHLDVVTFAVQRERDLVEKVVPFFDAFLPPCHKRHQFEAWRRDLLHHWEHEARRRRPCSVEGCDEPRRAKGLCRRHYYAVHGR